LEPSSGGEKKTRLLFVCSSNLDRSPAAESLFSGSPDFEAKSCGVNPHSRQVLTRELIEWADYVFVMEDWHAERVRELAPDASKKTAVLEVSNDYLRNDSALIDLLIERLEAWSRRRGLNWRFSSKPCL